MFSDLIFVFLTFSGLSLIADYSIVLGVIMFVLVTYFCTRNCLLETVEGSIFTPLATDRFYYLNVYACRVGITIRKIICSVRWSYLLIQFRKLLYVSKVLRGNDVEVKNSISGTSNVENEEISDLSSETCDSGKRVKAEIETIVNFIIDRYIKDWYDDMISKDDQFITETNYVIRDALSSLCNGLSNFQRKQLCCQTFQLYLHFFYHFKEAINKVGCEQNLLELCISKQKDISEQFKMQHWAVKDKTCEWFYLQSIMTSLVDSFGPVDFFSTPVLHSFVIELLTCTVLYPLVNTLSDPNNLNSWLLKLLRNIMKDENDLPRIINDENKTTHKSTQDGTIESSASCPIILIAEDTSLSHEQRRTNSPSIDALNDYFNISRNSSRQFQALERKSSTTSEIFGSGVSAFSEHSTPYELSCQSQFLLPGISGKAISNEDVSLHIDDLSVTIAHTPSEIFRMKRSKSADYIRPKLISHLLPSNRSSIRLYDGDAKRLQFKSLNMRETSDIEMAEEAKELPQLFTDIKITGTETQTDFRHPPYTLYSIQYRGIFQYSSCTEVPTYIREVVYIKRRFREFLALNSRLESNPALKHYLKGIKSPNIWKTMPFAHLDKKNVAERKPFLEKYLQDLCSNVKISQSAELQEFLAYGGDASIAFVKKTADIVPRIDKIIFKGVKGAFDLFRTALPSPNNTNDAPDANKAIQLLENDNELLCDDSISDFDFHVYLMNTSLNHTPLLDEIKNQVSTFDDDSASSIYDDSQISKTSDKPLLYRALSINGNSSCNCTDVKYFADILEEDNVLANVIIDLAVEALHKLPGPKTTSHVELLKFVFGSFLDRYVEGKLNKISEEQCSRLLHLLHKALWPEENNNNAEVTADLPLALAKYVMEKQKEISNLTWYNQLIHYLVGSDKISSAIEMLIGSFQNESLNKCLLFYGLDALSQHLCSKES